MIGYGCTRAPYYAPDPRCRDDRGFHHGLDIAMPCGWTVIGHVRRVYVAPSERVRRGQLVARASDAAAPHGCHLHFEVRPIAGGYQDTVRPHPYLQLGR